MVFLFSVTKTFITSIGAILHMYRNASSAKMEVVPKVFILTRYDGGEMRSMDAVKASIREVFQEGENRAHKTSKRRNLIIKRTTNAMTTFRQSETLS